MAIDTVLTLSCLILIIGILWLAYKMGCSMRGV